MSQNQERRHVTYDHDLGIEAYQLSGVVQKFPNHFHDFYVIGFIEGGQRHLWCKGREYGLRSGDLVLFNPRDSHDCSPVGGAPLDYRALNIRPEVMLKASKEVIGADRLPRFQKNVVYQSVAAISVGSVYDAILSDAPLNCPRLYEQHKKAPRVGILSFNRRGGARAAPLLFLTGYAHGCRSR